MFKSHLTAGLLAVIIGSCAQFSQAQDPEKDLKKNAEKNKQSEEQHRPSHPFDRAWLEKKAKALSEQPHQLTQIPADNPLNNMSYDDYKKIQFERGATIWSREERKFRLSPLHPGFLFKTPVKLNLVVGGVSRRILYTTKIFNYDDEQIAVKKADAEGYSGFSVTHPINTPEKWDEFIVFQGGTYFRAVGKNNWYGLSSRGLAINTGKPQGEEFPVFTEFWIERPKEDSTELVIHALMESQSATGAFTFKANPAEHTRVKVVSSLYPRKDISSFGIAPLTSMFLFNRLGNKSFDDFRPAVHDSDGLLMIRGNGERVWRALANPSKLEVSAFADSNIRGFGLMQRSRDFADFEDMEAHYHDRPSAWVKPTSDWGEGQVELFEIPTNAEIHDNIVAFWQPKEILKAGQEYRFDYQIFWGSDAPDYDISSKGAGKVVSSASGQALNGDNIREFVIDYAAENIPSDMQIIASASTGNIVGTVSKVIPQSGNLRVVVLFTPGSEDFSELRMSLTHNDQAWGETWLYRWTR